MPVTSPPVIDVEKFKFAVEPRQCPSTHGVEGTSAMLCTKDGPVCAYCGTKIKVQ